MLCKNCGKELPLAVKFCPFCGAEIEQVGVNDETAAFDPIRDETDPLNLDAFDEMLREVNRGPIDLDAFDAVLRDDNLDPSAGVTSGDPLGTTESFTSPRPSQPVQRPRQTQAAPRREARTTYYEKSDPDDRPYRKPSKGKRGAVVAVVVVLVIALIAGGVWFFMGRQPDENLTAAEKYMQQGNFDKALAAYQAALAEADDPSAINQQIDLLSDYQTAQSYLESGQYAEAIALLQSLKTRITDTSSPLYSAVEDLLEQASSGQSASKFDENLARASEYLANNQLDQCEAQLAMMEADSSLTSDQQKQLSDLRKKLEEARETAQRQEETEQQKTEQKQTFLDRIEQLEESDKAITSAATQEEELDATATSFQEWDTLLADMYDYLATILNADQYAAEEESYKSWVEERDEGAESAAAGASDDVAGQLAAASFKQSYTKTRCYKLLDMM